MPPVRSARDEINRDEVEPGVSGEHEGERRGIATRKTSPTADPIAQDLIRGLTKHVLQKDYFLKQATEQHLALTVHAFAKLGIRDDRLLLGKISTEIRRKINSFTPQGVANVLHGFAKLDVQVSDFDDLTTTVAEGEEGPRKQKEPQ
ncbi:unnamed protein product, partial [Amoebophrya sp. A120]|eukprot:GSA120T00008890001.1